uniref:Uncharacterized protein n=1 Tax=Setaria italica TaxID=4555 RepID=K3ZXV2_SETIT
MECSTRGGAGDEPVTALASGAGTPTAASRERWATSAAKAREGQTGSLPAGQHRYPNGGGTPAASSSRSTRRTCRSSQWELRSGAQAGGRMGMEGGRAWVSVGRGRGNRGGRRRRCRRRRRQRPLGGGGGRGWLGGACGRRPSQK